MTGPATRSALARLVRPIRFRSQLAWAALGVGLVALVLGVAGWLVRLGWVAAPYWVLVAWGVAIGVVVAVTATAFRRLRELRLRRLAARLEELGAWRRGALTALLDSSAPGTSEDLLGAADRLQAAEVQRRGAAAVAPLRRPVGILLAASLGLLVVGVAAFTSAGPVRGTAAALWSPARAWAATIAPVRIAASRAVVDQGDSVDLHIEAVGRRTATLWLRAPGESWRPRGVRLDSLGRTVVRSGPLTSDLFARVTSGSRASDTVAIRVRLPVFLGTLAVTARYPAYLGLDDEPVPTNGDTVLIPAGTRLETRGEATAPLSAAVWETGTTAAALEVDGGRFTGRFTPRSSGEYRLVLRTASGAPLAGDTVRLPIRLAADSAPVIEIPVPGSDTLAPLDLRVPLVIDARDDYGLASVVLESRRISRLGGRDSAVRETVPLPTGTPDRAILSFLLDLNRRGLLPGDTVRYFARAVDNGPQSQVGRSREFVLRLPTMSEVREAQRQATRAIGTRLDSIAARSRRVERQTEDLAREQPRATGGNEPGSQSLSFEEAKRAEGVAKSQHELLREAEEVKRALDELRRSAEAAGVADTAWQRQLEEIRDQLDRALSPELRERLAELQQALKNLDAEQTKAAMERLAEAQQQLREALERSRELFRRAALEGDLANLAEESRDLVQDQQRWNDEVAAADSARSAAAERQLADRADSLGAALDRVGQELRPEGRQEQMQAIAERARQAAQQMRMAAQSARAGQRRQARQQGENAAKALQPLGDQIQQERQEMQEEWRQEVIEAIDRALAETSRLSQRQLGVEETLRRGTNAAAGSRAEQAAVEEGVQKLLEQLRGAAGKNALVTPEIGAELASARLQMQRAREALSTAVPNQREAAERAGQAVDALNAAAYQLLRARGDVSGSGSGSGLAEAMERMAQLAQQQGGLGQQSGGLLPMAGSSGAVQEQIRRLGARQRALAEELEKLRGQGRLSGAGEMADEARELARRLEAGRLDRQTVERQERLFRRMLDAGRTLQGREEDENKERQSTTATSDSVRLPPALRARLLGDQDRPRMPSWEELQRLSPEERRLVVDYFRRLSETGTQ